MIEQVTLVLTHVQALALLSFLNDYSMRYPSGAHLDAATGTETSPQELIGLVIGAYERES